MKTRYDYADNVSGYQTGIQRAVQRQTNLSETDSQTS